MTISIGPSVLDTSLCILELRPRRRTAALQELVECAQRAGATHDPALLISTLSLRERLGTTAIGKGIAVPNARSLAVFEPRLVVARSRRGIEWNAPDKLPVQLVFLVLSPADHPLEVHHEFLGRAVALGRRERQRQRLLDAADSRALLALIREGIA
jgi:mannitol/fructose-specific phosphotransferase system IIA component (Ntr-type)